MKTNTRSLMVILLTSLHMLAYAGFDGVFPTPDDRYLLATGGDSYSSGGGAHNNYEWGYSWWAAGKEGLPPAVSADGWITAWDMPFTDGHYESYRQVTLPWVRVTFDFFVAADKPVTAGMKGNTAGNGQFRIGYDSWDNQWITLMEGQGPGSGEESTFDTTLPNSLAPGWHRLAIEFTIGTIVVGEPVPPADYPVHSQYLLVVDPMLYVSTTDPSYGSAKIQGGYTAADGDLYPYNYDEALMNQVFTQLTTPIPEPSTYIAGVLLVIPFSASVLRLLRKYRTT